MSSPPHYRSYRTPAEHGRALCEPPFCQWQDALLENQQSLLHDSVTLNGRSLSDLRSIARSKLVSLAIEYHQECFGESRKNATLPAPDRLILSGHQPELFHPGVWFKNFLLSDSAKRLQATAINLIIDQDLCRTLAIKVPTHDSNGRLRVESVSIESLAKTQPWEMLHPSQIEDWKSFPQRVRTTLGPFASSPTILDEMWPIVLTTLEKGRAVGEALALARHTLEQQWGLETWEVPLSRLIPTESFAAFFFETVRNPLHFLEIYNACRNEYRSLHRIRNQVHPVPALELSADWVEVPFWIYSKSETTRRSLWCRVDSQSDAKQIHFSDRLGWEKTISTEEMRNHPLEALRYLQSEGVCIRTRALTTTMYARLLLSDFFVHGIGGGKYDQLTDRILSEWLKIKPPNYSVASATIHFPLGIDTSQIKSVAEFRSQWWYERHHLERIDSDSFRDQNRAAELSEDKRKLLTVIPERGSKRVWHQRMQSINHELQESAKERLDGLLNQIPQAEQSQRQRSMALSREFSFGLFPQKVLMNGLQELATSTTSAC